MHVPQYHKKPGWQRFLVGIFFGALISYWLVLFMFGTMYERLFTEHSEIQNELDDAKNKIIALEEDLKEQSRQKITISGIDLEILNKEELKIDILLQHQLESLVKEEIKDIIGKDIETIADRDALLLSSIEKKNFKVDDFTYTFEIKRIIFASNVRIVVKCKIS